MDPDLFKQQLEQFAELKTVKVPKTAAIREAEEPEVIQRHGQELVIDSDNNPTHAWSIKRLKTSARLCEDCHLVAENRVIEIKRYPNPVDHWRRHCRACNLGMNPYNNKYELENKHAQHYNACWVDGKPEPHSQDLIEEKTPILKPHFKKPAK